MQIKRPRSTLQTTNRVRSKALKAEGPLILSKMSFFATGHTLAAALQDAPLNFRLVVFKKWGHSFPITSSFPGGLRFAVGLRILGWCVRGDPSCFAFGAATEPDCDCAGAGVTRGAMPRNTRLINLSLAVTPL